MVIPNQHNIKHYLRSALLEEEQQAFNQKTLRGSPHLRTHRSLFREAKLLTVLTHRKECEMSLSVMIVDGEMYP